MNYGLHLSYLKIRDDETWLAHCNLPQHHPDDSHCQLSPPSAFYLQLSLLNLISSSYSQLIVSPSPPPLSFCCHPLGLPLLRPWSSSLVLHLQLFPPRPLSSSSSPIYIALLTLPTTTAYCLHHHWTCPATSSGKGDQHMLNHSTYNPFAGRVDCQFN